MAHTKVKFASTEEKIIGDFLAVHTTAQRKQLSVILRGTDSLKKSEKRLLTKQSGLGKGVLCDLQDSWINGLTTHTTQHCVLGCEIRRQQARTA